MSANSSEKPNLETSLNEISELIDKMEHQDLSLEQSLSHFERGIILIKHCQKILEQAEQKVQILMQQDHQDLLVAYDNAKTEDAVEG